MGKKNVIYVIIVIIALLLSLLFYTVSCSKPTTYVPAQRANESLSSSPPEPVFVIQKPISPSNLIAKSTSPHVVELHWQDNSTNEDGFTLFRNNNLIANLGPNASTYQDTGLKPSTIYNYIIKAYNSAGESGSSNYQIKTLNPSISIRLDRIGVYDNRENWTRGEDGEVYIYVAVYDGKNPTQPIRFPKAEGQHYKLAKNETVNINSIVFSASEVGNNLGLTIFGFEDDGGGFEPLVYEALGAALEQQLATTTGGLTEVFNINLSGLVGKFMGEADDFLGAFERNWNSADNWGVGNYADIACVDERGTQCLRLWFTITGE